MCQMKIDSADLLAFIASGETMTSVQIVARWPEWSANRKAALERYRRERQAFRAKWGNSYAEGSADPMVASFGDAVHHWCYLPLIKQCLTTR